MSAAMGTDRMGKAGTRRAGIGTGEVRLNITPVLPAHPKPSQGSTGEETDCAAEERAGEEIRREKRTGARRAGAPGRFDAYAPVAADILIEARRALMVRYRFLDRALMLMPLVPDEHAQGMESDGIRIVYDPVFVVDRFRLSLNEVVRDLLHCVFHSVFKHPFMLYSVYRPPWDVACDIAIESVIIELAGDDFPANMDGRAKRALAFLRGKLGGVLTADRLYHFFSDEGSSIDLPSLGPMFFHDTHNPWYGSADTPPTDGAEACERNDDVQTAPRSSFDDTPETNDGSSVFAAVGDADLSQDGNGDEEQGSDDDGADNEMPDATAGTYGGDDGSEDGGSGPGGGDGGEGNASGSDGARADDGREEAMSRWDEVSRRVQMDLNAHLVQRGSEAGNLVAALTALHRERTDYSAFLRRFAIVHERMMVNEDEFDYIPYTFGLAHYGNMPLIEPLEYREDSAIRDFVIAIDTSESCSGELVRVFVEKTFSILSQTSSFQSRTNVHIVQCDAAVQEDVCVHNRGELEAYLSNFHVRGLGGTDFRPVFAYVQELIRTGDLRDLRGLLYFTDGKGIFPKREPPYKTAFVFVDDGYSDPAVPPWALKAVIGRELLEVREAQR